MEAQKTKHTRSFTGKVLAVSGIKTVRVEIARMKRHPKYNKQYKVTKSFLVHDELSTAKVGDKVNFVECRPLSASKRWRLIK